MNDADYDDVMSLNNNCKKKINTQNNISQKLCDVV